MIFRQFAQRLRSLRKISLYLVFLGSGIGVIGADPIDADLMAMDKTDGLWYFDVQRKPFTGEAASFYSDKQRKFRASYKDGKRVGLLEAWYENGTSRAKENYKEGKLDLSLIHI